MRITNYSQLASDALEGKRAHVVRESGSLTFPTLTERGSHDCQVPTQIHRSCGAISHLCVRRRDSFQNPSIRSASRRGHPYFWRAAANTTFHRWGEAVPISGGRLRDPAVTRSTRSPICRISIMTVVSGWLNSRAGRINQRTIRAYRRFISGPLWPWQPVDEFACEMNHPSQNPDRCESTDQDEEPHERATEKRIDATQPFEKCVNHLHSSHHLRELAVVDGATDRGLRVVASGWAICHNLIEQLLQFHDHFVRNTLSATPVMDRRYGRLVNATPTFNLLLRQAAPEEFGNDGLSVHVARILHLYLRHKYQSNPRPYYDCNI